MSHASHCVNTGCYYYKSIIFSSNDDSGRGGGVKWPLHELEEMGGQNYSSSIDKANEVQSRNCSMEGHVRIG